MEDSQALLVRKRKVKQEKETALERENGERMSNEEIEKEDKQIGKERYTI